MGELPNSFGEAGLHTNPACASDSLQVFRHWQNALIPAATIPVAIATAATPTAATALPASTAARSSAAALLRPIATLAVNRTVAPGLKGNGCGLSTTGADNRRAGSRTGTIATSASARVMMSRRGCALLGLAAWLAAPGRGIPALLEKLLLSRGKNKLLPAVTACK